MSKKYVIDLPDDAQYILINGASENHCYTRVEQVDDLEELNSDYINEHFGELQDEAYQRGLEDGKNNVENGCEGCKYESISGCEQPCCKCKRGCMDFYDPMSKDDRIEVGDEVISDTGNKFTVTGFANSDDVCGFSERGLWCFNTIDKLTKTGKHYDIQSILEAMRE